MNLIIDEKIRKNYSDLRIGVVIAKNLNNIEYSDNIRSFIETTFSTLIKKFISQEEFESHKNIEAWREIYRSFGVNPKKKKPSAESMLLRVIRNNYIPHISPSVDAYLCAETIHYLPIGGYDLNRISGDIHLRFSIGNEKFMGVGAENEESTVEGEIIYSDNDRILTRCWNYRDCDYTKIDTETKKLALFVEAPLLTISDKEIQDTVEMIAHNLETFCNATCSIHYLTKNENSLILS